MATIGSLVIGVSADAKQFNKELDRVRGALNTFSSGIGNIAGSKNGMDLMSNIAEQAKGIHPAMTMAAEGAQFFLAGMQGSIQQMRDLRMEADKFGTTINTIFELSRTKGGESLVAGLGKLQQQLGEAARGSTEARKKFDDLGLSWREMIDMDASEQLRVAAERVKEAGTASERTAISMDLMGKAGKEAVGVLSQGRAGLDAGAAKAHWLLSREDIENAERFGGNWKKIVAVWDDGWHKINSLQQKLEDMKTMAFGSPEDIQAMVEAREKVAGAHRQRAQIIDPQGKDNMLAPVMREIADAADAGIAIGKFNEELDHAMNTLEMGAEQAKAWGIAWKHSLPQEEYDAMVKKAEKFKQIQKDIANLKVAGGMFGGLIGDLEKFQNPLTVMLNEMDRLGVAVKDMQVAANAFDMNKQLQGLKGAAFPGLAKAMEAGGVEAVGFQNRADAEKQFGDAQKKAMEVIKQKLPDMLIELRKIKKLLEEPPIKAANID